MQKSTTEHLQHKIDFSKIDLASLSAHKFYGLKGIGILYKKENIDIEPLIHGGKSTTIYRSGTPPLPLIASLAKALEIVSQDIDKHYEYVSMLNKIIIKIQRVLIMLMPNKTSIYINQKCLF